MSIYINELFDIEIDFPSGWHFRTCGDKIEKSEVAHQYFKSDQDFPIKHDDFKLLFTAILSLEGSSCVIDASLSLSLIKCQADYSLKNYPNANHEGTKTQLLLIEKSGLTVQSLAVEFNSGEPTATFKYYTWPSSNGCWFLATLTACSENGRKYAENIFDLL